MEELKVFVFWWIFTVVAVVPLPGLFCGLEVLWIARVSFLTSGRGSLVFVRGLEKFPWDGLGDSVTERLADKDDGSLEVVTVGLGVDRDWSDFVDEFWLSVEITVKGVVDKVPLDPTVLGVVADSKELFVVTFEVELDLGVVRSGTLIFWVE